MAALWFGLFPRRSNRHLTVDYGISLVFCAIVRQHPLHVGQTFELERHHPGSGKRDRIDDGQLIFQSISIHHTHTF